MKPKTVYALVMTFEEQGEFSQDVTRWSLEVDAESMRRNFPNAAERDAESRLISDTLERIEVVPVLADSELQLAAHAVALTYEDENGVVQQSIELFERSEDAEAARSHHEHSFDEGSRLGRLIALTCEKTMIAAPISEDDEGFRSYMNAVEELTGQADDGLN